jgi:hypothetical protein
MVKCTERDRRRKPIVVDDKVKQVGELMRALDSPGMKMAIRAMEKQQSAICYAIDAARLKESLDRERLLHEYRSLGKIGEQMLAAKAVADMASASHALSESIFGIAAMREMASVAEKHSRLWNEQIGSSVAQMVEYDRTQHEQMSKMMEMIGRSDWRNQLTSISQAVKGLDLASFHVRFEPVGRIVAEADAAMRSVRWDMIEALEIAPFLRTALEFRTERLIHSYSGFTELMVLKPETIVTAPPFVAKMPALAVYSHAEALRRIAVPREEDEEQEPPPEDKVWSEVREQTLSTIDELLPRVSPELAVSWRGGWNTAHRQDADWVRQSAASFRYVLISVLDIAAPHERVKNAGRPEYLNKKGEVVRRGQVAWLCEPLQNKTYRKVVLADIESAIIIIDAMSEAVHRAEYRELEGAFGRMAVRAAVALHHILELHFQRP